MKWKPLASGAGGGGGGPFHKMLTWNFRVRLHFLENIVSGYLGHILPTPILQFLPCDGKTSALRVNLVVLLPGLVLYTRLMERFIWIQQHSEATKKASLVLISLRSV